MIIGETASESTKSDTGRSIRYPNRCRHSRTWPLINTFAADLGRRSWEAAKTDFALVNLAYAKKIE